MEKTLPFIPFLLNHHFFKNNLTGDAIVKPRWFCVFYPSVSKFTCHKNLSKRMSSSQEQRGWRQPIILQFSPQTPSDYYLTITLLLT